MWRFVVLGILNCEEAKVALLAVQASQAKSISTKNFDEVKELP